MTAHRHTFKRIGDSQWARCVECKTKRNLEELVYLGDPPRSVGMGNRRDWLSIRPGSGTR